jgi:hypothetical protein
LRERNELRQRLQPPPVQPPAAPASAPKEEDFATWQDFQDARSAYIADQRYEHRVQQEQQARRAQFEQAREQNADANWEQKTIEASTKYPDFGQKISTAPRLNPVATAVLKASPMAGDLAYHLAGNHDVIARLNGMHPLDQAAEIGRIEGKLAGSKAPPVKSVSKAPPPISPVGSGKTNSANAFDPGMSQEEYNAAFKPIW